MTGTVGGMENCSPILRKLGLCVAHCQSSLRLFVSWGDEEFGNDAFMAAFITCKKRWTPNLQRLLLNRFVMLKAICIDRDILISVRGTFIVTQFLPALSCITLYKALSVYAS